VRREKSLDSNGCKFRTAPSSLRPIPARRDVRQSAKLVFVSYDLPEMRIILCLTIACCAVSCDHQLSQGSIVDGYKAAVCIPVSANRKVRGPHTREWETPVTISDGSKVMVVGYQMPGGAITVRYVATGRELEAAYAGDYVYPSKRYTTERAAIRLIFHLS
jgi:hypothetical protein